MIYGLCELELLIAGSQSLKDKRQVLRHLKEKIRHKFNVSVAEVDYQDLWQRAMLGMACVGNDREFVREVLSKAAEIVESSSEVEVLNRRMDLQAW
jgi:uncharacterized protein